MANLADKDRYVVTGMGIASPLGTDLETVRANMMAGRHGIINVRNTLLAGYESLPIHVAAPVPDFDLAYDPSFAVYENEFKKWDTSQRFVLWSGAQALRQAGLSSVDGLKVESHGLEPERFGIYVGTGVGGAYLLADVRHKLENEKADYERALVENDKKALDRILESTRIRPTEILQALPGRVAGTPSLIFGAKGGWKGILQECASGNGAIITALDKLRLGEVDVALAAGVEGNITPVTTGIFGAARAVTKTKDADDAAHQYDIARKGLTIGQGSGALVIESLEHAVRRGAEPLAEIVGWHENSGAMGETEPNTEYVIKCLGAALGKYRAIDKLTGVVVTSHATSTPVGDSAEMLAIKTVLRADQISAITAPKSYTGHTLGACGAIEAIVGIQDLQENKSPPVLNLENPDPTTEGYDHLLHGSVGDVEVVVNSSFGFGDNNAVTVFTRPR